MIIVDCAGLRIEVSNVQIAFLDAAIKINQFIDYNGDRLPRTPAPASALRSASTR